MWFYIRQLHYTVGSLPTPIGRPNRSLLKEDKQIHKVQMAIFEVLIDDIVAKMALEILLTGNSLGIYKGIISLTLKKSSPYPSATFQCCFVLQGLEGI